VAQEIRPSLDLHADGASSGQALMWNGSAWVPTSPTGAPSGAAGGDLAGTYPNPTLAVDRVPKNLLTTKGDLVVATSPSTPGRLGVGSDGWVLTADSTQPAGIKWAAAPGGSTAELLMQDGVTGPPVPIETEARDDWLYQG
jgi:hypothetical protein